MSKHKNQKKEKKKRKRRSPSTSSSSSSDGSSGGEWVEKSPPPAARTSTKETVLKREDPPMTGPSFFDLALSSTSSREKKEKTKNLDRPEPIELPVGIYYPNKKQDNASSTSTKHENTRKQNHDNDCNSQRKDKYDKSERSNKQFQKPTSDDADVYSSRRKDNYDRSEKQSRHFQKPSSDDDENNYNHRRKDKYDNSDRKSSRQFQKPASDDEDNEYRRKDKYGNSEKQNSRQFQKPSSDSDDNYSSRRKDKYNRSEKQSSKQFQKPTSDDEDNYNSSRKDKYGKSDGRRSRQFQKPSSDSDDNYYSSQKKDKYDRSDKQNSRQHQKPTIDDEDCDSRKKDKYGKSDKCEEHRRDLKYDNNDQEKPNDVPVSHDDVNKIAAKLIKAEMMGNTELVTKLKAKLEVAKQNETPIKRTGGQRDARKPNDEAREKDRVVVITEQNMKDRRRTELLERKKLAFLGDNEDRWVAEGKTFANIGDEYEEEPDAPKRKKANNSNLNNQSSSNAIREHKKAAQILSSCPYCTGGDTKHAPILVDHYTEDVYLALPSTEPLTEHHCLIVTKEHIPGLRQTEPNVYNSVRSLCEKLVGLFSRRGKTCVFFETVSSLKRNHCRVHCVPMDREIGDDAPLYFQKSITDLETDTRHNRTLVKIARNALCRSIPAELEYFYVNFDWQEGFSHLIESKMSPTFAEEIIGGMLDLSSSRWRNPTRLSYETQMKLKLDFLRLYNS
uniref:CWF19-like protein 2 n=1 Tax=Cacopsylla melanoneura TaxID=428564 RepID=A0A8D8SP46_9HEMI